MILKKRRSVLAYRDFVFPRWKEELDLFLGFSLPVDVQWETLFQGEATVWTFQHLSEVYFLPLRYAIDQVAFDTLGRTALHAGCKAITVLNSCENFDSAAMATFDDGILTIDHAPETNVHEIYQRTEAIRRCLEDHL